MGLEKEARKVDRALERRILREYRFVSLTNRILIAQRRLRGAVTDDAWMLFLHLEELEKERYAEVLDTAIRMALQHRCTHTLTEAR